MKKAKVLFVSQEINPYLEITPMSDVARYLPQGIQETGKEIRTFMPRFGCINERRNQLHEVIRLSGMNLIIDDTDHPLIIKVASIQAARMQVYFIDNEEYFQRKYVFTDAKNKFYKDNDDRSIFFCRGVLETVKKLGWAPDIIHCHGWMTSLIPLFIKTSYKDDPLYKNAKVVYSVYDDHFTDSFNENFSKKVKMDGISSNDLKTLKDPTCVNINLSGMQMADAVIQGSESIPAELKAFMTSTDKPTLGFQTKETYVSAYSDFYDDLLVEDTILAG